MCALRSLMMANAVVLSMTLCINGHARAGEDAPTYPSDNNKFDGDILNLRVDVPGFKKVGAATNSETYVAPKDTKLTVTRDQGDSLYVRFKSVPTCESGCVDDHTQYIIDKKTLNQYDFKRAGVTFGGLVVPFKFYLGGDKKLSASSTVAPYIGYSITTGLGLTFTPIVSVGLGLVPVSNPATNGSETKTALSTAIGLVTTSNKNAAFNAGVIFGKDHLNNTDRANDPNISKPWLSFYVGYSL